MTEIETARLLLRPWRSDDLDAYARICADPQVMRHMPETLSREQASERIEGFARHWEEQGFGVWAVEHKARGELAGGVGLTRHEDWSEGEHNVEVGWFLARPFWGRGFATEGALASLRYGFEELGLRRIISITWPQNVASRRVMEKAGLTLRGETRWRDHDVVWYAMDRNTWEARNGDPGA